jgi:hypothetical protein
MARFPRQEGACTGGHKGAGLLNLQRSRSREPRGLQIGRTSSGSDPVLGSRTYEAAQAPWLPSSRSPSRGRGRADGLGRRRRGFPWLQPRNTRATATEGARALVSRRGARNPPEATPPKAAFLPGLRALHSAMLGPCRSDPQGTELLPPPRRASSNAPSSPRKRRRPCEGDAERVVRRHGSSASSPDLHGSCSLPSKGAGRTRSRLQKGRGRENEVTRSWKRAARAAHGPGVSFRGGKPSRQANADRGSSPARRRIPGSRACPRVEHALQRSVVQSWPREAIGSSHRSQSGTGRADGGRGLGRG